MFTKVLIANRGAIAVRILRTLRQMGITSVAVYAEDDADSLHVSLADESYCLGGGRVSDTYLNQDKLFAIIDQAGVEAVHPGYGFLSENTDFARRCEERGIAFIGPTPEQITLFGLKHEARRLARENDVPLLPGSGLLDSIDEALAAAANIGYPVMLKSTAGGGGIGMQLCHDAEALRGAYEPVRRLGQGNFANNGVFLEKFIARARHIEVQVFGDGQGRAVALGERDCSAQRRNQKVIEETPAPNLPQAVRSDMLATATRLLASVSYRNAGTVEYIYDQDSGDYCFLEVNTRLQVEHGVTELVCGIDLVRCMIELAAGELSVLPTPTPAGASIQVRLYAEDPNRQFQPCAGLLDQAEFPPLESGRIDTWVSTGVTVSASYDPMLAKVICYGDDRQQALQRLRRTLADIRLYGIETNLEYLQQVLASDTVQRGEVTTRFLNDFSWHPSTVEVISGGTLSTVQDYPGRQGYWDVGVPPSGPFDSLSFRLGNRLLGNPDGAPGLEMTMTGPTLRFHYACTVVVTGADMEARLDDEPVACGTPFAIAAGQTLKLGRIRGAGARSYLLIGGGLRCAGYLGSCATFTLGQFGGHQGRALHSGDVLHLATGNADTAVTAAPPAPLPVPLSDWTLRVIYGPHGAPEFFTPSDIERFFAATWEVHYNSSRTGVRLIGPKPDWARSTGGEAGMHPSNIHDNAYAFGAIDFTGDMPVILGPDGPSLGGFVCPAVVISADLWKLGQLRAGDRVRFQCVSQEQAVALLRAQQRRIDTLQEEDGKDIVMPPDQTILLQTAASGPHPQVLYRPAGDSFMLVEYGPQQLDIRLRFRVHALMLALQQARPEGVLELTPGIRSLQVHYDPLRIDRDMLLQVLQQAESGLRREDLNEVPARIVHLPLSWDDEACRLAIEKYMRSVRADAPWCPSNIEFIRRINGLDSIDEVKRIVFAASYLVMGLGDVYLGAPVATPVDPRHRLVTTKYNPARTWTAENSVGIGGAYLCVYGMEGPGGYQFVGRTLQMWNRHRRTVEFEQPWLLRFFDQIRFYEVTGEELMKIREDFPRGRYPLRIETTRFSLADYERLLAAEQQDITTTLAHRQQAFDAELQRWIDSGQINFSAMQDTIRDDAEEAALPEHCVAVESPVTGSVWSILVKPGQAVSAGETLAVLESMKMEIELTAPESGTVYALSREEGQQINAGQAVLVLEPGRHS